MQVVYAIMHRQEVLLPFRNHPRFSELLENIFTVRIHPKNIPVLDFIISVTYLMHKKCPLHYFGYQVLSFFNSHMDNQKIDEEWSVEKVLEVIINNCRSWRGEGMKV